LSCGAVVEKMAEPSAKQKGFERPDLPKELTDDEKKSLTAGDEFFMTYEATESIKGVNDVLNGGTTKLQFDVTRWTRQRALLFKRMIYVCSLSIYQGTFWIFILMSKLLEPIIGPAGWLKLRFSMSRMDHATLRISFFESLSRRFGYTAS